jgi:putative N6-adenine-specific DNA methylase
MVFNPPYDERLDIHMEEFYKTLAIPLKKIILEQTRFITRMKPANLLVKTFKKNQTFNAVLKPVW